MEWSMNTSDITLSALLKPPMCGSGGFEQESLPSLFRRTCEFNQLTVGRVIRDLILPASGILTKSCISGRTADLFGCRTNDKLEKLIDAMYRLARFDHLEEHTLHRIIKISSVNDLRISKNRRWCGRCFEQDCDGSSGPYHRLLWTIDDVKVCPIHSTPLTEICPNCGAGPFPELVGRDISGYCPRCLKWLGVSSNEIDPLDDQHSHFLIWCARGYAGLLETPIPDGASVRESVGKMIEAIAVRHYAGCYAHLATAIKRNRSVVSGWLSGSTLPSWKSICELSFAFQIPMEDFVTGQIDSVEFSTFQNLPLCVLKRITAPRKRAQKHDLAAFRAFFGRVVNGDFPSITCMRDVSKHLLTSNRELLRILPEESRSLAITLMERRNQIRDRERASRLREIEAATRNAVEHLIQHQNSITKRAVAKELALVGISSNRSTESYIRSFVRQALENRRANHSVVA